MAWLTAIVAFLLWSNSSILATSPSVRTTFMVVAKLLATMAAHVAQIWPLMGPAARSGSSKSAVVRLRTAERLATLPRVDDELRVLPLQS